MDGRNHTRAPGQDRLRDPQCRPVARGDRGRPDRLGGGLRAAVRILEDKSTYNTVEDVTGRMLSLRSGDVLARARHRRALRGYAGVVPPHLAVGDTLEVLNLGGILGRCTSVNPEIGPPFRAEVLGAVLAFPELGDRVGRPAHIRDRAVPPADILESQVPVVYGRHLHERGQDRRRHRAGPRSRARWPPGRGRQAHRRFADADALSMLDAGAARRSPSTTWALRAPTRVSRSRPRRASSTGWPPPAPTSSWPSWETGSSASTACRTSSAGCRADVGRSGVRDGRARSGGLLGRGRADAQGVRAAHHGDYRARHRQRGRAGVHHWEPGTAGTRAPRRARPHRRRADLARPMVREVQGLVAAAVS